MDFEKAFDIVCRHVGISPALVLTPNRSWKASRARLYILGLMLEHGIRITRIGRAINRPSSNAVVLRRRFAQMMTDSKSFREMYYRIKTEYYGESL